MTMMTPVEVIAEALNSYREELEQLDQAAFAVWRVNGHDTLAALEEVAGSHLFPRVRALAADAARLWVEMPIVREAYRIVFADMEKERQ